MRVLLIIVVLFMIQARQGETEVSLQKDQSDLNITTLMVRRLEALQRTASKSILVHMHIPKAGGTALSAALSTNCKCLAERPVVDGVSQANCKNCKYIRNKGLQIEYTISRSTGWKLGVHSPLSVMRWVLTRTQYDIRPYGVNATYIIMLRDPFDRFISEAINWVGSKGQAVDWSVKVRKDDVIRYYKGVNLTHISGTNGSMNVTEQLDYIQQYASLPMNFILHNRQTKMVGGSVHDFNMNFDPKTTIGSRWVPNNFGKSNYISKVFSRAQRILTEDTDVLLLLQERFAESICILEILYGHLYKFHWDARKHSHNATRNFDITNTSYIIKDPYKSVHSIWSKRNEMDVKLYNSAIRWFDIQFTEALGVLRKKLNRNGSRISNYPHCIDFIIL